MFNFLAQLLFIPLFFGALGGAAMSAIKQATPNLGAIGIENIPAVKTSGNYIVPRIAGKVIGSSTVDMLFRTATGTTICISSDCRTSWPAGTATTTINGVSGPTFTVIPVHFSISTTSGQLTLTLPQPIYATSSPTFQSAYLSGGILNLDSVGNMYIENNGVDLTFSLPNTTSTFTLSQPDANLAFDLSTLTTNRAYTTPDSDGTLCLEETCLATTTGNWLGTFDGQEGTYYLARTNHTGTQTAATISDFSSTARGLLSETITGIEYNSSTGVFSTSTGYTIPFLASTTAWEAFYQTPSSRITAGTNMTWNGNQIDGKSDSSIRGLFSGTSPITFSTTTGAIGITQSAIDHGSIGGLTDDDHTQYALLTGRSGGQTLFGGTASANDLTLQSTSDATKGKIIFGTASAYNQANDRFGLGTTTPASAFHIAKPSGSIILGTGAGSPRFFFNYAASAGFGGDFTSQMNSTDMLSFGFNSEATYTGTIASSTGRQMYFHDRVAGRDRLNLDGDGTFWFASSPTNYNLRVAAPSGSVIGTIIDTSGRVGIGTTTPQSAFQVWKTASTTARIGDTNSIGCLTMGDSDGTGVTYVSANNGVLSATTTKPAYCQ